VDVREITNRSELDRGRWKNRKVALEKLSHAIAFLYGRTQVGKYPLIDNGKWNIAYI
jgi:hypothetical protein